MLMSGDLFGQANRRGTRQEPDAPAHPACRLVDCRQLPENADDLPDMEGIVQASVEGSRTIFPGTPHPHGRKNASRRGLPSRTGRTTSDSEAQLSGKDAKATVLSRGFHKNAVEIMAPKHARAEASVPVNVPDSWPAGFR